jgi:hypothetical protein
LDGRKVFQLHDHELGHHQERVRQRQVRDEDEGRFVRAEKMKVILYFLLMLTFYVH